jgi:hypothetical protein
VSAWRCCRASSYRYQSFGYYISLLAEARGHRPRQHAGTIEGLQPQKMVPVLTARLAPLIEQMLAPLKADRFELDVYFGRSPVQLPNPTGSPAARRARAWW